MIKRKGGGTWHKLWAAAIGVTALSPREGNALTDKTTKEDKKPKKRNRKAESTSTPMKVRGYADWLHSLFVSLG